jgi:hypothetical protein
MTYLVQHVSRPYAVAVPESAWEDRLRTSSARAAYIRYNQLCRWYNPIPTSWSGHVRIVGSDGLLYEPYTDRDPGGDFLRPVPYSQYDADARRQAIFSHA